MSMSIGNDRNKAQNPMSEYLLKLQTIVNNTEFKNKVEANKYETLETREAGNAYVRAMNKTDIFESYTYDSKSVYNILFENGYDENVIFYFINNPQMIPQSIKNTLMERERENLISKYKERNKYYVRLTGQPFPGDEENPPEKDLLIPDEFYDLYREEGVLQRNQPVHEMPLKYQELFMNSEYYSKMVTENPDAKYLQYIGSNSIPIHVSRPARDGDIIRINTNKLSTYSPVFGNITVSPDIVHGFVNIYKETRDYVYKTLRGEFDMIYPNYDSFIRFLTIYLAIGNAMNEFMRKSSSLLYMNNVTANNFFMLYGLPSVIMEGASMIEFLKKFRMILMDKGTNIVYRVKDLIGYEYTDIYTLVMVKQQIFENGIPVYYYDDKGDKHPKQEIVFRRLGTTDDNTSYFKFRDNNVQYTVDEITSGDPRWWNTPEVEQMLQDMNYTLSNSKYIQLSTHLSMTDIWWQCVILLRGLLDRKSETQFTNININFNINGSTELSIFEAVLVLVIIMNWHLNDYNGRHMSGDMYLSNSTINGKDVCLDMLFNGLNDDGSPKDLVLGLPYKIASFNFRIREENKEFYQSINKMDYIEPDVFLPMLEKVLDREYTNIGEVLMTDVKLIYKYLEDKLRSSKTIDEFRQVTDLCSNLFLVEPERNWYDDTAFNIDTVLMDEYKITSNELASLKSFFSEYAMPELVIRYDDTSYPIQLYYVLNRNVSDIEINGKYPFRDDRFVSVFINEMKRFSSNLLLSSSISVNIKNNYQNIIIDKTMLDIGNTDNNGPKTFESLLFRTNVSLYRYLMSLKENGENLLLLMRSIIKALESYTNSPLTGLEFKALGVDQYFYILKEVISYFKSYMVEFTKEEFVYIFDGLFDNGGCSNMLRLYDDITSADIDIRSNNSLTLYDVSNADVHLKLVDNNSCVLYDEAIFRIETTYGSLLDTGYEIWYDDGKRITKNPIEGLTNSSRVLANIINKNDGFTTAYKIIINVNNNIDMMPPNYYGNAR